MISGRMIKNETADGRIKIDPFFEDQCGPNSYDLRLGDCVIRSRSNICYAGIPIIDSHREGEGIILKKNQHGGYLLEPGKLYLAHTVEIVGSDRYVPTLHGRSTAARHGIMVHLAAGFCDVGWEGQIVLEIINCNEFPTMIYPGDRICQVAFERLEGDANLYMSTYQNQKGVRMAKSLED